MTTKEIRDKLIEKRTMRQNAIRESERLCQEAAQLLASIDEQSMEVLNKYGFNVEWIKEISIEHLKTDEEYRNAVCQKLAQECNGIQSFLEEQLS